MPTIKNPVIPGLSPDPSIVAVGEDYYVATSSFFWFPAIPIFHSTDLSHWELVSYAVADASFVDLSGVERAGGVWAPDLSFDAAEDRFYLTMCVMRSTNGRLFDLDNYVLTAPSVTGPWSAPGYVSSIGFDSSMYHEAGRHWLLTLEWDPRQGYEHPGAIVLEEYDPATSRLIGPTRRISRGGTDRGCLEAPHLYHHDGWYYLMTAEGGTGYGHGVVVQRSRHMAGPYESDPANPVITSTPYRYFGRNDPDALRPGLYNPKAPLQRCGHGSLVHTHTDEWYVAHLSARPVRRDGEPFTVLGRETSLQKMSWTADGWLRLACGGTLARATTEGMRGPQSSPRPQVRGVVDHFDGGHLNQELQSPYGPLQKDWASLSAKPGWLRLRGRESFFSTSRVSLLAARVQSLSCTIETSVAFHPIHFSQSAGLCLYYDNQNFLFLRVYASESLGCTALGILSGRRGSKHEQILERTPLPSGDACLRAVLRSGFAQFQWRSVRGGQWTDIGERQDIAFLSDEAANNFTGLMAGIGTWDAYRRESHADFDYFSIRYEVGKKTGTSTEALA